MQIVYMSLTQGVFSSEWKTAIVRPLLKKAGLDLIQKNYKAVSNLCFLSKSRPLWLKQPVTRLPISLQKKITVLRAAS